MKSTADFLLYLLEGKLQPSTIDDYRSAIGDKLGNFPFNVSKDENLTCLPDSFHTDRSKGWKGIPSFEPIEEASLKQLTFKTVFLLTFGSGKNRSEIH